MILWRWVMLGVLWAQSAVAQDLSFPSNATLTAEEVEGLTAYPLPSGPWAEDGLPVEVVEGRITRQAWRIDATGVTTLQLLRPLREQLRQAGYRISFDCSDVACGGFDFRFAVPVMLPPAMEVDLSDFHFVAARNDAAAVSLLASRTALAGYVQVTWITPEGAAAPDASRSAPAVRATRTEPMDTPDLATALDTMGRHVLEGLEFATGSAQLSDGDVSSLSELADYLAAFPDRTVALVGHTDASGSLDGNIALSKRRAASVLERLVTDYQVPRRQLEAQGMGYLSPIASNLDETGRALNRRVEVIVTSTSRN